MEVNKERLDEARYTFTKGEVDENCKSIRYPKAERYEVYFSYFERLDGLYDKRPIMILEPAEKGRYYALELTHTLKPIGTYYRCRLDDWEEAGLSYEVDLVFSKEVPTVEKKWLRTYAGKLSADDIYKVQPYLAERGLD